MSTARLYILSGLPGTGKTTLAKALARHAGAAYLRIDTVEQALRDLCAIDVQGEGYRLAYRLASDNLRLGQSVVADSCNPITLTRREWERVAVDAGARFVNIEVVCSNPAEHRRRVEHRQPPSPGFTLPPWDDVVRREYHAWTTGRIVVDTFDRSPEECLSDLVSSLPA